MAKLPVDGSERLDHYLYGDTSMSPSESSPPSLSPEERRARVMALVGKYASAHSSVDEFIQGKQEEIDREEERWQRRQKGGEG